MLLPGGRNRQIGDEEKTQFIRPKRIPSHHRVVSLTGSLSGETELSFCVQIVVD